MLFRSNLKALWRLQDRYAIHPLGLSRYGPHRRRSAIATDLAADCAVDVVIVHLNPDTAPALLTAEHRAVIERARHRIGFWLWETLQVPHDWSRALSWVDSLWVPSRYCQELFAGLCELPIHRIPHVIDVQDETDHHRPGRVDAQERLILYSFDGASYLRRKNPTALVRAFHRSGLAARGWRLCLKTKNLDPAGYDTE